MPAAAVIPAPIAYTKVVAVKKLVVELRSRRWPVRPLGCVLDPAETYPLGGPRCRSLGGVRITRTFTLKKSECSKQALFARIH